ncbi:MAG TPA: hypothetical protein VF777_03080 [Phycisphaerales bacterium]
MHVLIRCGLIAAFVASAAHAQSISPEFGECYNIRNVGSIPGVPGSYGGLCFKYDDPDLLLIGGAANQPTAAVYAIRVTRDSEGIINGFVGTATKFADAPNIDGGLTYGPGNVLFFTRYSTHAIGQIKPGQTTPSKDTPLASIFGGSTGSLQFVPDGYPGAGRLKVLSYNSRLWADINYVADGNGTYDILGPANSIISINPIAPEGIVFVQPGNPGFTKHSVLISDYSGGRIEVFDLDANGDPVLASKRTLITGFGGPEGGTRDPRTGHFMFSTFTGNRLIVVTGFNTNCAANLVPDCGVDDLDFQVFAPAYNILDCADPAMPEGCPADLNEDGFVDDLDFQIFAVAYDGLICN